jgi:hypothetical protein
LPHGLHSSTVFSVPSAYLPSVVQYDDTAFSSKYFTQPALSHVALLG